MRKVPRAGTVRPRHTAACWAARLKSYADPMLEADDPDDPDGDSTPGAVTTFGTLRWHGDDSVGTPGDVDYHGIRIDRAGTVQVVLGNLDVDLDVAVTDTNGTVLVEGTRKGLASERVRVAVPAGDYLVRVQAKDGKAVSGQPYEVTATRVGR